MREDNIERVTSIWTEINNQPLKTYSTDLVEHYIKKLCELCEYDLKGIKWINEYNKIEGLHLINKQTTVWSDFFNVFYSYSQIYEIDDHEWRDENEDVADQTTLLSLISSSVDAFGEKDGIFYCLKIEDSIINSDNFKKHFI